MKISHEITDVERPPILAVCAALLKQWGRLHRSRKLSGFNIVTGAGNGHCEYNFNSESG